MKLLEPVSPEKAAVEFTLTSSADGRTATLTLKSDSHMSVLDFAMALCEYASEIVEETYVRERRGKGQ